MHFLRIRTSKSAPRPPVFNILTSKCASCHSGVQFLDIRTSKSAPGPSSFLTFWLHNTLFATAPCNFLRIRTSKSARTHSFLTFWLHNTLFATAACNFLTSELQKVLRGPQFFNIFTCKFAFRHSRVQFLMSPLSTYLRTRRFNRPTFRLTRHTKHWKNTAFRDFSNIWQVGWQIHPAMCHSHEDQLLQLQSLRWPLASCFHCAFGRFLVTSADVVLKSGICLYHSLGYHASMIVLANSGV